MQRRESKLSCINKMHGWCWRLGYLLLLPICESFQKTTERDPFCRISVNRKSATRRLAWQWQEVVVLARNAYQTSSHYTACHGAVWGWWVRGWTEFLWRDRRGWWDPRRWSSSRIAATRASCPPPRISRSIEAITAFWLSWSEFKGSRLPQVKTKTMELATSSPPRLSRWSQCCLISISSLCSNRFSQRRVRLTLLWRTPNDQLWCASQGESTAVHGESLSSPRTSHRSCEQKRLIIMWMRNSARLPSTSC